MAKGTKAQEVSTGTSDSYTLEELADPTPPIRIQRAMLGVVPEFREAEPSVGTHSSQSSESENTKSDSVSQSRQAPAQMTESLSGQPESETDSIAASTAGVGQTHKEPLPSDETVTPAKKSSRKARTQSIDVEDFNF